MNVVVVAGRLSRAPEERVLPSGDRVVGLEVTVPGSERAESVPVAWLDAPAWVLALEAGATLTVLGRVRRRFFRAGSSTQSRTEVVVERGAPGTAGRRAQAVFDRAAAILAGERGDAGEAPFRRR